MAMHECAAETIEADEGEWRRRLRALTKDFVDDEPRCLVVEELGKPGFIQIVEFVLRSMLTYPSTSGNYIFHRVSPVRSNSHHK